MKKFLEKIIKKNEIFGKKEMNVNAPMPSPPAMIFDK